MAKKQSIIFDIHGTLVENKGEIHHNLFEMMKVLSKVYAINLVTARYYENDTEFQKDNKELLEYATTANYCKKEDWTNDAEIKKDIYLSVLKDKYNVVAVIDNNKSCCKMFRKLGINILRFKKGK